MADSEQPNAPDTSMQPVLTLGRLASGLLALALSAWAFFMGSGLKSYPFEHSFQDEIDSPVLALELASNSGDVNCVLHRTDPDVKHARCATELDNNKTQTAIKTLGTNTKQDFLFIPLYTLFLWSFAALFAVREDGKRMPHLWVMALLAVLTGGFDCWENARMLHVLNTSSADAFPATPSLIKWGFFAAALVLTGVILARSWSPIYSLSTRRLLALAYGVAGVLLLIGLIRHSEIELGVKVFSLLVAVNIVALLGPYFERRYLRPRSPEYVDDFCARRSQGRADVAVYPKTPR